MVGWVDDLSVSSSPLGTTFGFELGWTGLELGLGGLGIRVLGQGLTILCSILILRKGF